MLQKTIFEALFYMTCNSMKCVV